MTNEERDAFIDAYKQNGEAPEEHVKQFMELYLNSDKDVPYDEYYTGIADALSVWHCAISWQLKKLKDHT